MNEIIIRTLELPPTVRAFTLPDAQGDYNIYLNCALSSEQQQKSLLHEREHISRGDFEKTLSAAQIEREMERKTNA
ncbi:MAG: hypothetical protein IJT27_02760 [Clostridia bacterium]|nr:hypothetical protein [Clostridia bacterium]